MFQASLLCGPAQQPEVGTPSDGGNPSFAILCRFFSWKSDESSDEVLASPPLNVRPLFCHSFPTTGMSESELKSDYIRPLYGMTCGTARIPVDVDWA